MLGNALRNPDFVNADGNPSALDWRILTNDYPSPSRVTAEMPHRDPSALEDYSAEFSDGPGYVGSSTAQLRGYAYLCLGYDYLLSFLVRPD